MIGERNEEGVVEATSIFIVPEGGLVDLFGRGGRRGFGGGGFGGAGTDGTNG